MRILTGRASQLPRQLLDEMYTLRRRVFVERLGWDVPSTHEGEVDEFDHPSTVYVLSTEANGRLTGCLRLLPTEGPYMLEQVFPVLLGSRSAPRRAHIWEMSRFAFDLRRQRQPGWGFSGTVLQLVRGTMAFAAAQGIERYLLATTLPIERMMRIHGMHAWRLGFPRPIGKVTSVGLALEADGITRAACGMEGQGGPERMADSQSAEAHWLTELHDRHDEERPGPQVHDQRGCKKTVSVVPGAPEALAPVPSRDTLARRALAMR